MSAHVLKVGAGVGFGQRNLPSCWTAAAPVQQLAGTLLNLVGSYTSKPMSAHVLKVGAGVGFKVGGSITQVPSKQTAEQH